MCIYKAEIFTLSGAIFLAFFSAKFKLNNTLEEDINLLAIIFVAIRLYVVRWPNS